MLGYHRPAATATRAARAARPSGSTLATGTRQVRPRLHLRRPRRGRRPVTVLLEYATDLFDRGDGRAAGRAAGRGCSTRWPPTRTAGRRRRPAHRAERAALTALERHRAAGARRATLPELFAGAGRPAPRTRSPWSPTAAALTYAELDARAEPARPAAARAGRRAGAGRRAWRCRAPPSWSSRCSACSRPAPPTCRSTPTYPAERLAFMLADAGAGRGARRPPTGAGALPASDDRGSLLDAGPPAGRLRRTAPAPAAAARPTPPTSSTPPGSTGHAQGRGRRPPGDRQPAALDAGRATG